MANLIKWVFWDVLYIKTKKIKNLPLFTKILLFKYKTIILGGFPANLWLKALITSHDFKFY